MGRRGSVSDGGRARAGARGASFPMQIGAGRASVPSGLGWAWFRDFRPPTKEEDEFDATPPPRLEESRSGDVDASARSAETGHQASACDCSARGVKHGYGGRANERFLSRRRRNGDSGFVFCRDSSIVGVVPE